MAESRRRRYFQMPDIDQPDPEPGYQHTSDEFVVPSIDEDGDSVRCQCRVPGQLYQWLGQIVNSRKFPFQRDGDLMRYAIFLACVQLSKIENAVPNLQHQLQAAFNETRRRHNAAQVMGHLDKLGETIADLQKQKAWGEITYILAAEQRHATETLVSEPYWGQRWLDGLHDRFEDVRALAESKLETIQLFPAKAPVVESGE